MSELEKTPIEKYLSYLRQEINAAEQRSGAIAVGRKYFDSLVALAEKLKAASITVDSSLSKNDNRPRFWLSFDVNSFRDMAPVFLELDNFGIKVDRWKENECDEDTWRLWGYSDEQLEIFLNVWLSTDSTCEKRVVGEKMVKRYVLQEVVVPVVEYICPEQEDKA